MLRYYTYKFERGVTTLKLNKDKDKDSKRERFTIN